MFSMLLPLDATAARHVEAQAVPPDGRWIGLVHDCWNTLLTIFRSARG